jgi:protein-S-isoprenylcysteine O-methyltransferase Ste14
MFEVLFASPPADSRIGKVGIKRTTTASEVRVSISPPTGEMTPVHLRLVKQRRKRVLAAGMVAGLPLFAITDPAWQPEWPHVYRTIQWSGLLLILICILGRTWTTLYIGGLKRRTLVTKGPYSVVRNPLYLFTLLGATDVGAHSGSLTMAAVCSGFAGVQSAKWG